jgi:hypothetical protein
MLVFASIAMALSGFPLVSNAAYPSGYVVDGFVEQVSSGTVKGWVYQNDQPVTLVLTFQNATNESFIHYKITNAQQSNQISYWEQRTDVKSYLNSKYKANLSFSKPQSFMLTGFYMPLGTWTLESVTVQGIVSKTLPINTPNKTFVITSTHAYNEGYIDTTSNGIKGWAYSSSATSVDIAPEIKINLRKTGTDERKTFILPKGSEQNGNMIREVRYDVVTFLTNERGQEASRFASPSQTRNQVGFTMEYAYPPDYPNRPLSSGTWEIESIMADDFNVVYGNTNPSHFIIVQ